MTRSRFFLGGLALVASVVLGGCGPATPTTPADSGPTAKQALDDLAELLKSAQRPPARQADLQEYEAVNLGATLAITQKTVVYQWGQGLSGGPAVIAYDAKAPSDGGYVLLQDGTVKQMTAAEFAAAPKAGKK